MEGSRERDEGGTKVPWIVGGFLVVLLVVAGSGAGGSSSSSMSMMPTPPPANARGVLLPGDGTQRTVVVPSCGTPASIASQTAPGGSGSGVVTLQLGGSAGARALLVPDCTKPSGGAPPPGSPPPSAAFVLPVGTTQLQDSSVQVASRSQVIVPAGSRAKTVVVPACVTGGQAPAGAKHQDVVLSPKQGSDSATAPSC